MSGSQARIFYAAGGQIIKHIAVSQQVRPGHGIKHGRSVLQCHIVDILHAGKPCGIAHVAVHSQRARADADHLFVAAGHNFHFPADHIGDDDFRRSCRSVLLRCLIRRRLRIVNVLGLPGGLSAAGCQTQNQQNCQKKR